MTRTMRPLDGVIEAIRKAELVKRWQAGDKSVYPYLFPEQWAADQRQAQAHRNALELAKAKEAGGKYVDGVGMVSPSGVVTPLTDASGQPYMTPKQRKENMDASEKAKALENQKAFALQTAKTQLTSLDNIEADEGLRRFPQYRLYRFRAWVAPRH